MTVHGIRRGAFAAMGVVVAGCGHPAPQAPQPPAPQLPAQPVDPDGTATRAVPIVLGADGTEVVLRGSLDAGAGDAADWKVIDLRHEAPGFLSGQVRWTSVEDDASTFLGFYEHVEDERLEANEGAKIISGTVWIRTFHVGSAHRRIFVELEEFEPNGPVTYELVVKFTRYPPPRAWQHEVPTLPALPAVPRVRPPPSPPPPPPEPPPFCLPDEIDYRDGCIEPPPCNWSRIDHRNPWCAPQYVPEWFKG